MSTERELGRADANKEALERLTVEDIESLRWIADHQPKDARDLIHRLIAEREGLEREVAGLKLQLETTQMQRNSMRTEAEHQGKMRQVATAQLSALQEAAQAVVADIKDYERINHLAPNPGKPDCWQSVTRLRALLPTVPVEGS